jgi:hypothetical protein
MAHDQDKCEVNMVIHLNPTEPWIAIVIRVELDGTVEQTTQVALTSLCESRLTDTAARLIALFPIRNQEDLTWKQRLEAVSNLEGPHFHAGMAALAGYAHHMFNLQASTAGPSFGSVCTRARLSSTSRSWGMQMPSSTVVRLHLQTRTMSFKSHTAASARLSTGGTTSASS